MSLCNALAKRQPQPYATLFPLADKRLKERGANGARYPRPSIANRNRHAIRIDSGLQGYSCWGLASPHCLARIQQQVIERAAQFLLVYLNP